MKLSPMWLSFVSAFLLSTTVFAENSSDQLAEELFADSVANVPEADLRTLGFVLFEKNSSKISPENDSLIAEAAKIIQSEPRMQIELTGHTDNSGSDDLNQKLAKSRAEMVRARLIEKGVDETRINALSFGKDRPIAENESAEGQLLNRQVTIWGILQ